MVTLNLSNFEGTSESFQAILILFFFTIPLWFIPLYLFAPEFYQESELFVICVFVLVIASFSNFLWIIFNLFINEAIRLEQQKNITLKSLFNKETETKSDTEKYEILTFTNLGFILFLQYLINFIIILLFYISYKITGRLPFFFTYLCVCFISIFFIIYRSFLQVKKETKNLEVIIEKSKNAS